MTTLEAPPVEQANPPAASSPATKPPGLTERLAVASARRPKRTLAIWGLVILVALVLIMTSLKGLTSNAYVVGGTQSKQAEALYSQVIGSQAAGRTPTDVIVVSSASSTVADASFRSYVSRLIAEVRTDPGISSVGDRPQRREQLVSSDRRAALIELRAATDADIKPVVKAVQAASGSGASPRRSPVITRSETTSRRSPRRTSRMVSSGSGCRLPSSCWCSCSARSSPA